MTAGRPILVVEDEDAIRTGICDLLAYHGHQPQPVANGEEGLEQALSGNFDLVMLDVMLPGRDGFSICETLRSQRPGQAILMLTARGNESDVLRGFECGCDDYVTKPFSVSVLRARVEALLRRAGEPSAASEPAPRVLHAGPITLDLDNLTAVCGTREIPLTTRDSAVLEFLFNERHRIVPRLDLLREVWGHARAEKLETRCVDMHLVKLRRRLAELLPNEPSLIETVRGAGYRLRLPEPSDK